jgi:hypothetical protein
VIPSPQRLAETVREAILGEFSHDSCIASTLAVIEVCRYFGVTARPQPTTIRVYSPLAWRLRDELAATPPADWPSGAHSVGIDGVAPHKPGRWNGHLVALTATHLIDASLDQFARPARGLVVKASAFPLPPEGWRDGRLLACAAEAEAGVAAIIYDRLDDADWKSSPNWRRSQPALRRVVGAAIRELRESLDERPL